MSFKLETTTRKARVEPKVPLRGGFTLFRNQETIFLMQNPLNFLKSTMSMARHGIKDFILHFKIHTLFISVQFITGLKNRKMMDLAIITATRNLNKKRCRKTKLFYEGFYT